MFYGCRCHLYHFIHNQMIEFTVTLSNTEARKRYLTIQSATFSVDIDGLQMDWLLISMPSKLMLLKVLMWEYEDDSILFYATLGDVGQTSDATMVFSTGVPLMTSQTLFKVCHHFYSISLTNCSSSYDSLILICLLEIGLQQSLHEHFNTCNHG